MYGPAGVKICHRRACPAPGFWCGARRHSGRHRFPQTGAAAGCSADSSVRSLRKFDFPLLTLIICYKIYAIKYMLYLI